MYCQPSTPILLGADVLHPVDHFAIEGLRDGDVRHACGCRGAVPMLLGRREPDYVAGPDVFDGAALSLYPAATGRNDQCLAERVRVPSSSCTRLESHYGTTDPRGSAALKTRVDAH